MLSKLSRRCHHNWFVSVSERLTSPDDSAFNAQALEGSRFSHKVDKVFQLAKKEAIASGIFFGGSGLTGNLTMLCLLGYGTLRVGE